MSTGPRVASSAAVISLVVVLPVEPVIATTGMLGHATHVTREIGEGLRGVGHAQQRQARGRQHVAMDHSRRRPSCRGLGQEGVAVEAGPGDGDEELAGLDRARVDRDARERRRARLRSRAALVAALASPIVECRAAGGQEYPSHAFPLGARRPSTSRATCRSSKGTVRSRSTW